MKSSTKFHFKLRKALKRDLERNCKSKNDLEFDVEKDDEFFFEKNNCLKKINL